jgi:hypothetical protein
VRPPNQQVMLRVMARCPSPTAAPALQAQLLQALAAFPAVMRDEPARYGKMPELVEFTFTVAGPERLRQITALCGLGWTDCGDEDTPSWVWNARPGACFLHPAVTWAEVLLVGR